MKLPEVSFGQLISHTFPGAVLFIAILFSLDISNLFCISNYISRIDKRVYDFFFDISFVIVSCTMLGVLCDGIHHYYFWDAENWTDKQDLKKYFIERNKDKDNDKEDKVYKKYQSIVVDDLWYYYESYANVAIAMIIGGILIFTAWLSQRLPHLSGKVQSEPNLEKAIFFSVISFIYIFIVIILIKQAFNVINSITEIEKELSKSDSEGNNSPSSDNSTGNQGACNPQGGGRASGNTGQVNPTVSTTEKIKRKFLYKEFPIFLLWFIPCFIFFVYIEPCIINNDNRIVSLIFFSILLGLTNIVIKLSFMGEIDEIKFGFVDYYSLNMNKIIKKKVDDIVATLDSKTPQDIANVADKGFYFFTIKNDGELVDPTLAGQNLNQKAKAIYDKVAKGTAAGNYVQYNWRGADHCAYVRKTSEGLIVICGYKEQKASG